MKNIAIIIHTFVVSVWHLGFHKGLKWTKLQWTAMRYSQFVPQLVKDMEIEAARIRITGNHGEADALLAYSRKMLKMNAEFHKLPDNNETVLDIN